MRYGLLAAIAFCTLRGCVVYEIRDTLAESNARLQTSNERLTEIKTDLARTNAALDKVQEELSASTASLADVRQKLQILESIGASLQSIDTSLKAVRALIERIPIVGKEIKEQER